MAETLYGPDLRVSSLFSRSFDAFKQHLWPTVGVFVIYALLTSFGGWSGNDFGFSDIISIVIGGPITAGAYYYAVRVIRGEGADIGQVFRGFQVFGKALIVWVLYGLMVIVGMVFLIIPGIYLAIAFAPAMYLILDDDLDAIETLRKAWRMSAGHRLEMFIVALALLGLNILGLIALLVGVIFTGALSLLIGAAVYDELARSYE